MKNVLPRIPRKLLALPAARRSLVCEAAMAVAAARFLLLLFPLRRVRPLMAAVARRRANSNRFATAGDVAWALLAVTRRFSGTCLANAVAAQTLLMKYGYPCTMRVGAALKEGHFAAHAWVERDGEIVVGGPRSVIADYAPFPDWDGLTL
jgi:hypothetical protein